VAVGERMARGFHITLHTLVVTLTVAVVLVLISPSVLSSGQRSSFGDGVCGVGDVDGDEVPDLAVGVSPRDADGLLDGMDELRVISGKSGTVIHRRPCFLWVSFLGCRPALGLGDVNADGHADFVVRRGSDLDDTTFEVVSGIDWKVIWRSTGLDASTTPITSFDWNGDGKLDVVTEGEQRVRVRSGIDGALLTELEHPFDYNFHRPVRVLGDINGDQVPEVAIPNHTWGINSGCLRTDSGKAKGWRYEIFGWEESSEWNWSVWHFGECQTPPAISTVTECSSSSSAATTSLRHRAACCG